MKKFSTILLSLLSLSVGAQVLPEKPQAEKPYRFVFAAGYSQMTNDPGEVTGIAKEYHDGRNSGNHFLLEADFFYNENGGLGIKYSRFNSFVSIHDVEFEDDQGNVELGTLESDTKVNFLAGNFIWKVQPFKNPTALTFGLGLGYVVFNDDHIYKDPFEVSGDSFGVDLHLGTDIHITKNYFVHLAVNYFGSSLRTISIDNGEEKRVVDFPAGQQETISRIDFSLGIAAHF